MLQAGTLGANHAQRLTTREGFYSSNPSSNTSLADNQEWSDNSCLGYMSASAELK